MNMFVIARGEKIRLVSVHPIQNTSELVAIDIEGDYRFYIDGEDVTMELMPDIDIFRPVELDRLTWNIPVPAGSLNSRWETKPTVPPIGRMLMSS